MGILHLRGLDVDLDADGEVLDLDFAAKRFDLSQLETFALPIKRTVTA